MVCKYKYKGHWYSEDELRNKIGNEFFERETFEVKEYGHTGEGTLTFEPVRDMSIIDIFEDDIEELGVAQDHIVKSMGKYVYIGDTTEEGSYAQVLSDTVRKQTGKDYYVPETLDIALQKVYNNIKAVVEQYDEGSDAIKKAIGEKRYSTFKKLSNFSNFKKVVHSIYPESRTLLTDEQAVTGESQTLTIRDDIKENIKQDQKKSQSKFVRFLTAFVDYKDLNDKGEIINKVIDSPDMVYAILIEAMSGSFNYNLRYDTELKRVFKRALLDLEKPLSKYSINDRKILGIYKKIDSTLKFLVKADKAIKNNPVLNSIKFENENTFIFDTNFTVPIHGRLISNVKNIQSVKRISRPKQGRMVQDTTAWIDDLTNEINQLLQAQKKEPITARAVALAWTHMYNKSTITDLFSLMSSQRNSYPYLTSTNGKFGETYMTNRPAGRQSTTYDVRSIIMNRLVDNFLTKEKIEEFKATKDYDFIIDSIKEDSAKDKIRGIQRFIAKAAKMTVPTIKEDDPNVETLADQIEIFFNILDTVNFTEDDRETVGQGLALEMMGITDEEGPSKVYTADIVEENGATLTSIIGQYYDKQGEFQTRPVAISADGTMIYPMHNSSYTERIHDFINTSVAFNNIYSREAKIANFLPPELQDPLLAKNPIMNKKMKIGRLRLYRGHQYYSYPIMYKRERTNDWFMREFSSGFITAIKSTSNNEMRWDWFYPPISNKPNAKSVELSVLGREESIDAIQSIIDIIKARPKELDGLIKSYDSKDTLFMRELDDIDINKKNAAQLVYQKIIDAAIDEALDFVIGNKLHISKDIRAVEAILRSKNKIDSKFDDIIFKSLKKRGLLSQQEIKNGRMATSGGFSFGTKSTDETTNRAVKKYELKVQDFINVYANFAINNQIATFVVPHLTMGDPAFFKNENDFIKRLSIFFSPGTLPFIEEQRQLGSKSSRRIAIFKEFTEEKEGIRKTFEYLFKGMPKEELDEIIAMFPEDYDRADAQGFMTEAALDDLIAGTGFSYSQGTAVKPVIAGRRNLDLEDADGNITSHTIPTAIKYASFVLTEQLRKKDKNGRELYPRAVRLMDWMKANKVQEVVFQSGVKVGSPNSKYLYHLNDVVEMNNPEEFGHLREEGNHVMGADSRINNTKLSVIEIDTNSYRVQQNPNTDKLFKKNLRNPSQLTYILNIAAAASALERAKVDNIYRSMYNLMTLQAADLTKALSSDEVSSELFSKALKKKMAGPGNELYAQFLKAQVDVNLPVLLQKITIQFASYISDDILATKFPGGKFQLVSDVIFNNPRTGKPLTVVREDGKVYAEVLVPRKFQNRFPLGSVFGIDGFTVRIPTSGIHSTLPFKIVGFVDEDSDVFIAPKEITPVQGSDFDADAVFAFRDFTWSDLKDRLKDKIKGKTYGQVSTVIDKTFGVNTTNKNGESYKDTRVPLHSGLTDAQIEQEVQSLISKLKGIEMTPREEEEIKKQLRLSFFKQNIISNVKSLIMQDSNHNKKEMFSPIYMGLVNDDTNSVYEYIAKERGVDPSELLQNLHLSRIANKNAYYHRNFDGNMLTGIFANLFKAVSYMDKAGVNGARPKVKRPTQKGKDSLTEMDKSALLKYAKEKGIRDDMDTNSRNRVGEIRTEMRTLLKMEEPKDITSEPIMIGDTVYEQLQESTTFQGREISIRMMMDIFINLAIDNVKEQGLPTINATGNTASTYVMGLWLGIPLEDMVGLMLSPMARRISYLKKRGTSAVMKELEELWEGTPAELKQSAKTFPITKELLKKQVTSTTIDFTTLSQKEIEEQYALANLFKRLSKPGRELNELSMYLSVIQNMRVNFKDIEKLKNYFAKKIKFDEEKYLTEDRPSVMLSKIPYNDVEYISTNFDMPELFKSAPHIYSAIVGQRMLFDYITEVLHIYSQNDTYESTLGNLQQYISEGFNEEDRKDFLRKEILHFLSASLPQVASLRDSKKRLKHPKYNYTMDELDTWQYEFSLRVQNLQEKYLIDDINNAFLRHVQITDRASVGRPFMSFSRGRSKDPFEMIRIQSDFNKLPADIQADFINYAIMFFGGKYGSANFTLAIPASNFKEFSQDLTNLMKRTIKKGDMDGAFGVMSDLMEIEVMINSYDRLFHFNANTVSLGKNRRIVLENGETVYYDMSHGNKALPEGFQPDVQQQQEEDSQEDDVIELNKLEGKDEDSKKQIIARNYVARSVFASYGKWETEVYKRIDIPFDALKEEQGERVYYSFLGRMRTAKKYTFDSRLLDTEIGQTRSYDLKAAFNPFYPYVAMDNFTGQDVETTIFEYEDEEIKDRTLLEGTNVVLYDANDLSRKNGKIYRVVSNTTKKVGSGGSAYTSIETKYELVEDGLPVPYAPERLDPPASETENTLDQAEVDAKKDKAKEILKKKCKQ